MIGKPAMDKGTYRAYRAYRAYGAYGAYGALNSETGDLLMRKKMRD
jgi:hypothetical protein